MVARWRSKLTVPVWALVLALVSALAPTMAVAAGSCSVAVTDVDFGLYDVFTLLPTDGTGTVMVTCIDDGSPGGLNIEPSITLSASATSGATLNRQMMQVGGADRLNYNLFHEDGSLWGDTPGVDDLAIPRFNVGKNGTVTLGPYTIHGRIPAGQDVSVGTYTDSVVLSIIP
jgi:spore coat protein U-like protein